MSAGGADLAGPAGLPCRGVCIRRGAAPEQEAWTFFLTWRPAPAKCPAIFGRYGNSPLCEVRRARHHRV